MTTLETIRLVAAREVHERIRSKAFRATTAFSALVVLAIAVLPGLLRDDAPDRLGIVVAGPGSAERSARIRTVARAAGVDVDVTDAAGDVAAARAAVARGAADGAVVAADDGVPAVVVDDRANPRMLAVLQAAERRARLEAALLAAGVEDPVAVAGAADVALPVTVLDPPDPDAGSRRAFAGLLIVLLYGQLLGYGYWVANGVVEEKASRVVELVLAKVSPGQLLAGKILGIGGLGFVQLVGLVVFGLVAASTSDTVDLPPGTVAIAAESVLWFALGFTLYSSLFAVAGAMASRAEEMQATTTPISIAAVLSFIAASVATEDPESSLARVATFLPPSAPLVLAARRAAGTLPTGELLLAVGVLLVAIAASIRLAARAYSGGALNVRGQLRLRAVLRRSR